MKRWRLIIDGSAEGAWNMAVDRAMLDAHEADNASPTLRLYGWRAPTVSLGRFQAVGDVDRETCDARGVELCHRPTGGRGVLHDDEITYSIVAGTDDGLPRSVAGSYRMLCGALVAAYRELGIDAALTARARGPRGAGACYLHATAADLSLGAAKLSGSAQVWAGRSCLQHGSFVISRDASREAAVFRLGAAGRTALDDSTDTIIHALGRRPDDTELYEAIVRGIGEGLGIDLAPGEITPLEHALAEGMLKQYRVP